VIDIVDVGSHGPIEYLAHTGADSADVLLIRAASGGNEHIGGGLRKGRCRSCRKRTAAGI